ncbi:hypothetical protein L2E82_47775 [Cichorium intybus]|uniref:Uncharacterized protein n=1 Tax=Cichorium intybus TaxID=13427 RepID=A0ACB8YXN1_CICIN|nr:hypothetical protein L2E82_47775 [Cichorium intybus]
MLISSAIMAGAVLNPQQVTRTVGMATGQSPSPSMLHMNSFRISAVVDRLLVHARGGSRNDSNEFFNLCISLSRGIDYAVANNQIPVKAPELPGLLKQVCQCKNDTPLQAAIMVLLISLKSACRNGWFNEKDKEELENLSNEISRSFCSVKDKNSEDNRFHHNISAVMSRFFPSMKMGQILASVDAMPGYGAFVKDFDITTKAKTSDDKIYLFVAQMDDTETSSCIISPQQVNFLLNGKAVDGRNCVYKDPGPQTPTVVTHMLKSGTNLLQVVGQFNGKYIIVVAFMSTIPNQSCPILPNYVPPAAVPLDSDNEIIEGPSRVSLNCPISFKRIKTPIKGQSCKHPQCFDYDNYVDINSRRPSWRCPHCSQSVCFTDIRIDRIMVKVLKEVGVNVSHVKISADGSWEAVNEGDDHTDKPQTKPPLHQPQNMGPDVMDLTEADNYINATTSHQDIDKKPSLAQLQNHTNPNNQIPVRNIPPHMETALQKIHIPNGPSNTTVPPVPNAISRGQSQGQISASNNTQSGRFPTRGRGTHVTRIPIGVQALPAQQRLDGFHMNPHHMMRMASPPRHMGPQEFGGGYQYTLDQFNSHQMSPQFHQGVVGPTAGFVNNQHANHYAMSAAQQRVHVSTQIPSGSMEHHGGQAPRMLEVPPTDQNWRPSGRMRGSLSGQAYADAINQFMYYPTQPVQATRPPVLNTPRPVIPPHLQFLMANNRNMIGSQDGENRLGFDGTNGGGFRW